MGRKPQIKTPPPRSDGLDPKATEADVLRQIMLWGKKHGAAAGIAHAFRVQSGVVKVGGRMVRMSPEGTPDICGYLKCGHHIGVEVKKAAGKPTLKQEEALAMIRIFGGVGIVARHPRDVEIALRDHAGKCERFAFARAAEGDVT